MRRRRPIEVFNLSFLDVVCCGFGAIILLFVLSKKAEPVVIEAIREDLSGIVADLESRIYEMRGEATIITQAVSKAEQELSAAERTLTQLQQTLSAEQTRLQAVEDTQRVNAVIEGKLALAQQELSEEMQRLLGNTFRRPVSDATIGGVPVDSEYIIFIIDTSGSMFNYGWALVQKKVAETLDIYPNVKGIQVMNDMGDYMFTQYAGRWIPDTPARRKSILSRLRSWNPFSNSSPVEGITRAINTFYAPDKKISLYVFGDEFSTGSIEDVVTTVDRLNKADAAGNRRVRIHTVGFPVQFGGLGGTDITGIRFAALMRALSERNDGTFVGLNSFQP